MEFLVLVVALIGIDLVAGRLGSRDAVGADHLLRAFDGIRGGDAVLYQSEMRAFERRVARLGALPETTAPRGEAHLATFVAFRARDPQEAPGSRAESRPKSDAA